MDDLKQLLFAECTYRMKDDTMDEFLGLMTEVKLKKGEPLIPYWKFDNNIYVLKSGIIRSVYFEGSKETTFAFALPGTVIISYHSFYRGESTFFQTEACCESSVMKVTNAQFLDFISRSNDFAQWVLWLSVNQLWHYEKKLVVVNGDASERFESLLKNRPGIFDNVPLHIIASYIGITPQHLSRLKRRLSLKKE